MVYLIPHCPTSIDAKTDSIPSFDRPGAKQIDWTAMQATFLDDESSLDVLMIIDCCKAASSIVTPSPSVSGNIVFVLAAPGFDSNAPLRGDTTYTANLTAELCDQYDKAPTVTHFASLLLSRLSRLELPSGQRGVSSNSYVLRDNDSRTLRIARQPKLVTWNSHTIVKRADQTISTDFTAGMKSPFTDCSQHQSLSAEITEKQATSRRGGVYDRAVDRTLDRGSFDPYRVNAMLSQTNAGPSYTAGRFPCRPSGAETPSARQTRDFLKALHQEEIFPSNWNPEVPQILSQKGSRIFEQAAFHQWMTSDAQGLFWIVCGRSWCTSIVMSMILCSDLFRAWNPVTFGHSFSRQGLSGFYRSLLVQLLKLRPDRIPTTRALIGNNKISSLDHDRWETIWSTILGLTRDLPICILVEIDFSEIDAKDISLVLDRLSAISMTKKVKLCVASEQDALGWTGLTNVPSLWLDSSSDPSITSGAEIPCLGADRGGIANISFLHGKNHESDPMQALRLTSGRIKVSAAGLDAASSVRHRSCSTPATTSYAEAIDQPDAGHIYWILQASRTNVVGTQSVDSRPMLTAVDLFFAIQQFNDPNVVFTTAGRAFRRRELSEINCFVLRILRRLCDDVLEPAPESEDATNAESEEEASANFDSAIERFLEMDSLHRSRGRDIPPADFDANLVLLGCAILQLKRLPNDELQADDTQSLTFWPIVEQGLLHAQRVPQAHEFSLGLYISQLDDIVTSLLAKSLTYNQTGNSHWSTFLPLGRPEHPSNHDTLLSLAIEYAIANFVKATLAMYPEAVDEKAGRPLLHYAIFPSTGTTHDDWNDRLDLVRLLLECGADQNSKFGHNTIRDLVENACMRAAMCTQLVSPPALGKRHEFLSQVRRLFGDS